METSRIDGVRRRKDALHTGNYVKMVHNGIEYGDMQLISEACK